MDFGVVVSSGWGAKQILESGCLADSLGLDFFVTDHYITPMSDVSVDAWAVLAAKTERVILGTCVTPIPFRPPQILAKVVATVDQISDGRAVLGVGANWSKPEFDAYSSWDEDRIRVAKTVEGIELMTKLWASTEPFDFNGKYYSSKGVTLNPKPVQQPYPPLWFGGRGQCMLKKVAATYGDAWLPPVPGVPEEEYTRVLSLVRGEGGGGWAQAQGDVQRHPTRDSILHREVRQDWMRGRDAGQDPLRRAAFGDARVPSDGAVIQAVGVWKASCSGPGSSRCRKLCTPSQGTRQVSPENYAPERIISRVAVIV